MNTREQADFIISPDLPVGRVILTVGERKKGLENMFTSTAGSNTVLGVGGPFYI